MKRGAYFVETPGLIESPALASSDACDCATPCDTCCQTENKEEEMEKKGGKKMIELDAEEKKQLGFIHRHIAMHAANDEEGIRILEEEAERQGVQLKRYAP